MTIWVSSDLHIDHLNIIRFCNRPFKDVADMQNGLVERWNSVVKPDDECWHLGDFAFDERSVPGFLKRINGTHHLVMGNHDPCFPTHKNAEAVKQRYLQYGFLGVYQEIHNWHGFHVAHMPYLGQEEGKHGQKYSEYRPIDKGQWLLSGHVHSKPENRVRGKIIDVGIDPWNYFPVSLDTLIAIRDNHNLIIKTNSQ